MFSVDVKHHVYLLFKNYTARKLTSAVHCAPVPVPNPMYCVFLRVALSLQIYAKPPPPPPHPTPSVILSPPLPPLTTRQSTVNSLGFLSKEVDTDRRNLTQSEPDHS